MSPKPAADTVPATYQPNKRSIGELLTMTSPPIVVPDWQRNYSWTSSHIETFWNDLLEFERRSAKKIANEYFLGSVVIVETSKSEHLLLDGQQRLATSAILLSTIRDYIKAYKADASQRIQVRYLADFDDAKNETIYKLTLNVYDREYFRRKILEPRDGSYVEPDPEHASHSLIAGARNYFEGMFDEVFEKSKPEDAFNWSLRIQDVLMNHMTVIAVTSTDEDSAAEVFETLNDRGIGLSTPDLLRNLVIRRADEKSRDVIVELWGEVIEFETDTLIKNFLRHYWVSIHGDVKTQGLYREIKTYVVNNNLDSLELSRSLKDASNIYREILSARDDDETVEALLKDIAGFGAGSNILYPVILSIFQTVSPEHRAKLIEALLNLYVRHSVICRLENSKLENVIYRVARELRQDGDVKKCLAEMASFAPDDATIINAFQRLSIAHNGTRRYLLTKLEDYKRATEELGVNSPSKVHVEHIYPQNPKEGEGLPNHNLIINRLGNLTLLSARLNKEIQNGNFAEKKPHYEKSDIILTKELCDFDDWDEAKIDERQDALAELAPVIWPVVNA